MKILFDKKTIQKRVAQLGREISNYYKKTPFVCLIILKGSFVFGADLIRAIESDSLEIDFIKLSSYSGRHSTGVVDLKDELSKFRGKNLLLVEDIVDTGATLSFFMKKLEEYSPASVKVCSLLEKKEINRGKVKIDFLGFDVGDDFIVGYGLDYNEKFRNIADLVVYEG